MQLKASIVIRCYNEEQHIGKLLSGIMQQTYQDFEIILVDSGSTDATLSIAARYPVRVISITPEEFSFGRSLNLGCQAAQGEYLVIVSAHVYPVHKDWLEQLLKPFNMPQVALVYGKQRGNTVTKYSERQVFSKWFPERSNYNQDHPFCNNANAAVRCSLWQEFPYDEQLTGLEDLAWSKQIIESGYCTAYSAEAEIIHVHDESFKRIYNRYRREAIAFKRIFSQEHFNLLDFFRLFITNVIADYYHAIHDRVLFGNLLTIPLFRLMQFWGTYQGFCYHGQALKQLRKTFYYPRALERSKHEAIQREMIDYSQVSHQEVPVK
ncbi:MAG: glycosyltransferase family 2 protein [Leptolyngbyaceae cyanobacterium SU_3_3]|nr:glycosyltransferase family 2 protein [Leptolyngbyaceae cyanobacterium SU_3_3]